MCELGPEHRIIGQSNQGIGTLFPELFINNPTGTSRPPSIRDIQNLSRSMQPQNNSFLQPHSNRHRTAQHHPQVCPPNKQSCVTHPQKFLKPALSNSRQTPQHPYQGTPPRPQPNPNPRQGQPTNSLFHQPKSKDTSKIHAGLAYNFSAPIISKHHRLLPNPERDPEQRLPRLVVDSSFHLKQKINKNKWFIEGMQEGMWKSEFNTSMKRLEELNKQYVEGKN